MNETRINIWREATARLLPAIRRHDLLLQAEPDLFVDFGESGNEPRFRNVARTRKINRVFGFYPRAGTGREQQYTIGHRDGFFEVMRNEQNRSLQFVP